MAAGSAASQHRYEFDGSILEGGGQVLRQSVALAAILDKNVRIVKVRGKRTNPGLQRQHLTGIDLVTRMTRGGKLEGAVLKSAEVEFKPSGSGGGIACFSGPLEADSKGAGAVALLLQVSLPCAIVSPSVEPVTLVLKGGTNAAMAPQIDYAELVFVPTLRRLLQADISVSTIVRGFYPRGQGEVRVQCKPMLELPSFTIVDRGEVEAITIRAFACNLDAGIAERLARAAEQHLRSFYPEATFETDIRTTDKGVGPGAGVLLVARTTTGCLIGGDGLGEPGKEAGKVGREAAINLVRNLERRGAVDEYLQDQLIIYGTLATGISTIRVGEITMHTETAIHFAREIAHVDIQVEKQEDNTFLITIQGLGYQNKDIGLVAPLPSPGSSPHLLHSGKQGTNSRGRGKQQRKRP